MLLCTERHLQRQQENTRGMQLLMHTKGSGAEGLWHRGRVRCPWAAAQERNSQRDGAVSEGWAGALPAASQPGEAVPALDVLTVFGRHAGKLQKLLEAMSINHWLCECRREGLKREISNKSKICQSFWQSLESTCES